MKNKYPNFTPTFPEFYYVWDVKFTSEEMEKMYLWDSELVKRVPLELRPELVEKLFEYKLDKMPIENRKQFLRFWDRMWDWDWSLLEKWKHKIT